MNSVSTELGRIAGKMNKERRAIMESTDAKNDRREQLSQQIEEQKQRIVAIGDKIKKEFFFRYCVVIDPCPPPLIPTVLITLIAKWLIAHVKCNWLRIARLW